MTIIVADATCGLPRDLLAQRGVPTVPQVVIFGEDSYHDDKELDTATFLQKLKASPTLPKTAAPEPPLYYPIFKAAQQNGESVIVIAPSAKGGCIGGAKKLLAELLEIKPILTIREGQVEPFEQQRTKKRAMARPAEVVAEQCPRTAESYLSVLQVAAEVEAQAFVAELKELV